MMLRLEIGFVDFERAVVVVDGEERRLRPLELKLLAYLRARPDRVLSAQELLRDVWGYASGIETRTLYATVNRLRLTLERDPTNPTHILTVPRLGYRFRPAAEAEVQPGRRVGLPRIGRALIGRERDVQRLTAQTHTSTVVTLRGAAGVGKSRLALELAHAEAARGTRVIWCGLGDARTVDDILRELNEALGLGAGPAGPATRVRAALKAQPAALVIFDDVDLAVPALTSLMDGWLAGPTPTFLITCRSRIGIGGEIPFALGPLPVPDRASDGGACESGTPRGFGGRRAPAEVSDTLTASGRLLEVCLREREPDVEFDPAAPWVRPLLQSLGGLPLAIEIAAPWLTVMGGPGLLEHVRHGVHALHGPRRVASPRHRSLGESLAWSWSLLEPWARTAIAQCACFESSFDLRAAAAVVDLCAFPEAPPLHDVLLGLVERSWLRVEARPHGQYFAFYVGQREFVTADADPELLAASTVRHGAFHTGLASSADLETLYVFGGSEWLRLRGRAADLRAALARAEGAALVQLVIALARILLAEGPLDECLSIVDLALKTVDPRGTAERVALLHYRAIALRHMGRTAEGRTALNAALDLAVAPTLAVERGRILRALGVVEMYHGDPAAAAGFLTEAMEVLDAGNAPLDAAIAVAEAGTLAFLVGDAARAITLLERGLGPLRSAGAGWVYAVYLVNLGVVELVDGRVDSAEQHLLEARTLQRQFGSARFEALALGNLALVAERRGETAAAHAYLDEAFALTNLTGDQGEAGTLWSNRGLVHLREGAVDAAVEALERAAALAEAVPIPRLLAEVLARRARVSIARQEWAYACQLLDRAEAIATRLHFTTELAEVTSVRARLDAAQT